jgi:hypothetical protein
MDDDDPHRWREEEQIKREAAGDLLAHIRARSEADEARTRQLLDALTAGVESEEPDDNDDYEEAA